MARTLTPTTENNEEQPQIITRLDQEIVATTALAALPSRAQALDQPYTYGLALFAALGGETLLTHLNQDQDLPWWRRY